MPIELDEPVEQPELPAKQYPLLWLYNLQTHAPDPLAMQDGRLPDENPSRVGSCKIEALPMAADGSLLWSQPIVVSTDELYRMADEVPEVAAAFAAILAAVKPAKAWVDARQAAIAAAAEGGEA